MKTVAPLLAALLMLASAPVGGTHLTDYLIHINGDADLLAQATANDWPGAGTATDPIVIAGLWLDGASLATGAGDILIRIESTTLHLELSDLHLFDSSNRRPNGIILAQATNVTIRDSHIEDVPKGIEASAPRGIPSGLRIINNTVDATFVGIRIYGPTGAIVQDNDVTLTGHWSTVGGIHFFDATGGRITGNRVTEERIEVDGDGVLVDGNTVMRGSHSSSGFIDVYDGTNEVRGNHAFSIRALRASAGTVVADNTATSSLIFDDTTFYGAVDLVVKNNTAPVLDGQLDGGTITGNDVDYMEVLIRDGLIADNDVVQAELRGSNTLVRDNRFYDGGFCESRGVSMYLRDSVFTRNHVVGYDQGMILYSANALVAYDNYFANEDNILTTSDSPGHRFWVDPRPGPNIVGGPSVGGNFWGDYDGPDQNGDGFGDIPHGLVTNHVFMLPDTCHLPVALSGPCVDAWLVGPPLAGWEALDLYPLVE